MIAKPSLTRGTLRPMNMEAGDGPLRYDETWSSDDTSMLIAPSWPRQASCSAPKKRLLLVLDFDGFLINSYALIRATMASFGLDVGDEERFKNRRKFLKYFGGGKELMKNLVRFTLPKTRKLRAELTACYRETGTLYPEFVAVLNDAIANPAIHCGILSRNFTLEPGPTMRAILRRSGVNDADLDFVVPIPVGVDKTDVLQGMRASRYFNSVLAADEIGDYRAGTAVDFECLIGSYGFDTRERLITHGEVPAHCICDTPAQTAAALTLLWERHQPPGAAELGDLLGAVGANGARHSANTRVQASHE